MATLYVTEPGARIEKEHRRILVTKEDEVLLSVPLTHIGEVVLVGYAGATTAALLALLHANVGLTMISRSGRLLGRLRPPEAHNLPLRHKQYALGEDPRFCLRFGRAIVRGKLANCRTLAMRMMREKGQSDDVLRSRLNSLSEAHGKADIAQDLAALRGIEGSGARAYFAILRRNLKWKGIPFSARTRRPPKDPINALLSLGYSLLNNALIATCEVVGLDPYDGFYHADKYGRPGLALDLMEEFRPLIVDSLLLTLINKRILKPKHFMRNDDAFFLTRVGFRKFFEQFNRRMNTKVFHPIANRSLSYQKCFEIQARLLRHLIEGKRDDYVAMATR